MTQLYFDLYEAAAMLGVGREALRKRIARGAMRRGDDVVCDLGDGVIAVKTKTFRRWRVRFQRNGV